MRPKVLIVVMLLLLFATNLFAQKRSKLNWFGYVKSGFEYKIAKEKDQDNKNQFKLILATLGCKADINEYSSLFFFTYFNYKNHGEPYIAGLLDAQIWFTPVKNLKLVIGQFVTPYATENLQSSSKIDFINRSYVAPNSPAYRDIGAYADYRTNFLRFYLGTVNGSGMNCPDNNNHKNIILRGEISPISGLKAALATSIGKDNQSNDLVKDQDFYSANLSYRFRNIYITAEGSNQRYLDDISKAFYIYATYDFPIESKLLRYIIPAFRYDFFNNPYDAEDLDRYTFGLTFGFDKNKWLSHFRLNYEIINTRQNRELIIGEVIKYPDVFTAEFQMRFE